MKFRVSAVAVAVAAVCSSAAAQSPPTAGGQASVTVKADSAKSGPPVPAAPPVGEGSTAPDAPLVAYIVRPAPPQLVDDTPSKSAFGLVGLIGAVSVGSQIVRDNGITNPANDVALELAKSYASAHGYRVADRPIVIDKTHPSPRPEDLAGAQYLVDAQSGGMTLMHFSLDWTHFDIMMGVNARVFEASNPRKAILSGRCFHGVRKTPESPTHDALLADSAKGLKALIKTISDECAANIKTGMKL